jgi:glycosyltransferase involved in cell wall biosynthesis
MIASAASVAVGEGVGVATRPVLAPQISVICTAKNAATTIEAMINSILGQDFHDWEMIVVDDGSTDATAGIVRRFASADPRIRLITTAGLGRGAALNRAVAETAADLIANIDADDESHPARLRLQLWAMGQYPQFGLLCTRRILIFGDSPTAWPDQFVSPPVKVVPITSRLRLRNPVDHSSVLMSKHLLLKVGGYCETRRSQFDYDLWVRLAQIGCELGRLELPLIAKRIHSAQSFENKDRLRYLASSMECQLRAIRSFGGTLPLLLIPVRVLWLLLPARCRVYLTTSRGLAGWIRLKPTTAGKHVKERVR